MSETFLYGFIVLGIMLIDVAWKAEKGA